MCSFEPNCPFPPDPASLFPTCRCLQNITRDAEIPCLPHCWWFLSVLRGNKTLAATWVEQRLLPWGWRFPTKHNLVCLKNGVTSHNKLGSARFLCEIRGQLSFLAVHIYSFPPLNTVLCTMCPAHIRSWECSHVFLYLPLSVPPKHSKCLEQRKGVHVSCSSIRDKSYSEKQ